MFEWWAHDGWLGAHLKIYIKINVYKREWTTCSKFNDHSRRRGENLYDLIVQYQ